MPDVFRSKARTFWFAARFLPADRRAAVTGLYAFARALDDLVDEPQPARDRDELTVELAAWRHWLEQPIQRVAPDPSLADHVLPALLTHGVPRAYLQMLVEGVASDLDRPCITNWSDLRHYCVMVASSVGLAMCHLLGAGDNPLARDAAIELGIAMQLTNILRDVGADLRAGRIYLPVDELARHGYSPQRLVELATRVDARGPAALDDQFRDLMRAQIDRARSHYNRGIRGVARLPADSRMAILLAARLYQAILDEIQAAGFDVFTRRAATSTRFKVVEAMRCAIVLRQPTWPSPRRTLQRGLAGTAQVSNVLPLVNR